jgi:23S rRNA (adenine2503-C2)-methyltransferase
MSAPAASPGQAKVNLLGLSRRQMEDFFLEIGEKKFRAQQVLKWIHHAGVTDIGQMTNLGKALREKLQDIAEVRPPEIVSQHDSSDGTRKWAIRVDGGGLVESVLIPDGSRATLCVSSQVGCSLDCSFCSTGKQGFQRDLSAAEVLSPMW